MNDSTLSVSRLEKSVDTDNRMVAKIRNLERFCNEIASNKLLWTPEILIFFSMPHDMLAKLEFERERY